MDPVLLARKEAILILQDRLCDRDLEIAIRAIDFYIDALELVTYNTEI
jgi:hypothetical protein